MASAIFLTLWVQLQKARLAEKPPRITIEQVMDSGTLLVLRANDELGYSMGALVYFREGVYERLIGTAVVLNLQTNGLASLKVLYEPTVELSLIERIAQDAAGVRANIIVRPGVPSRPAIPEVANG